MGEEQRRYLCDLKCEKNEIKRDKNVTKMDKEMGEKICTGVEENQNKSSK